VTIHWRDSSENPRSVWADGSAMFTIVASSTTISCAMPMSARISQRRRLPVSLSVRVEDISSGS
jgi:hypothetical protein